MNRRKKGLLVLIVLLVVLAAVYFFGFGSASIGKYVQYQHPELGFILPVPEDWTLTSETEETAAWQSPKADFALLVMGQLGGYSYYDMNGMGNIMGTLLKDSVNQWEEVSREVRKDLPKCYRIKGQGLDANGNTVVTDGLILEPMQAVRFYVIALAGPTEYRKYQGVLEDVYDGFDLVLSADEVYTKMMELKAEHQAPEDKLPQELDDPNSSDS